MNFVTKTNMFDVVAKEIPCLTGAGAPNGLTKGAVGCLYMDKNDGMMYKCTGLVNGFYTWVVVDEMKIHIGESEPTDDRVTVWVDTDEEVEPPKDGYTPIKGVDYWTEEDKAEMVSDVIAALPIYDGVYFITPSAEEDQTLATAQTYVDANIKISKIPYAEVTNNSGGTTATIGGN